MTDVQKKEKVIEYVTEHPPRMTESGNAPPGYWAEVAKVCGTTKDYAREAWRRHTRGRGKPVQKKDSNVEAYLRAQSSLLAQDNKKLREALGEQEAIAHALKTAIEAQPPVKIIYSPKKGKGKPEITAVLLWSDWHIGEIINSDEIEGFNSYNADIARKRLNYILQQYIDWINVNRTGLKIDHCVVMALGDYISGDIHYELQVTNEFPVPVQVAKAGLLMGEAIRFLAQHFTTVTVHQVGADNHSRLVKKPQYKQKYFNSLSYLVDEIARAVVENQENVIIDRGDGIKKLVEIQGFRFLLEHGDIIKAWMGIPYYGLQRNKAREAVRRMNTNKNFHYYCIGHWHVPSLIENSTIVNGSLCGTTEFDHGQGRYAQPSQVAFLVGRHGVFNLVPFTTTLV